MSTEEQKTTIEHQELFPISTFKLGEYPNNSYFDYFLMLEDDFFNTRRYVEICKGNFNSYSFEFDKIIKLACAAIEDLLKLICGIQPSAQTNIAVYRKYFSEHFADFHKIEVYCLLSTPRKIRPWLVWESERTPGWWGAYNSIKHSQSTNFKKATQHNALKTLAA
ncbi:MAG TPA: hypothetical protein VJB02_01315, partial [Coxiellaceae bacterium]|nr:hypothetical protein [Coxiellaceae bacterium]